MSLEFYERSHLYIHISIVGNQGAGKTTLLNALLYEYEPDVFDITHFEGLHEIRLVPRPAELARRNKRQKLQRSYSLASREGGRRVGGRERFDLYDDDSSEDDDYDIDDDSSESSAEDAEQVEENADDYPNPYELVVDEEEEIEYDMNMKEARKMNQRYISHGFSTWNYHVEESSYSIFVDRSLVTMHSDTCLRIADFPGLDKLVADGDYYKQKVVSEWSISDCIIVVVDGTKYQSMKENVELFKFVMENQIKHRAVPIIIVINKADMLDKRETKEAVEQYQLAYKTAYKSPYSLGDRQALKHYNDLFDEKAPPFIVMSAIQACLYHTAIARDYSSMDMIDRNYIDKIGSAFGHNLDWNEYSTYRKYRELSARMLRISGNSSTAFGKEILVLIKTLEKLVGGKDNQLSILSRNSVFSAYESRPSEGISEALRCVLYLAAILNDQQTADLFYSAFEILFDKTRSLLFVKFQKSMDSLHLSRLIDQFAEAIQSHHPRLMRPQNLLPLLDSIVKKQYETLIYTFTQWQECRDNATKYDWDWMIMSPLDWERLFNSLLLFSNNNSLLETFSSDLFFFKKAAARCEWYNQHTKVDHCYLCSGPLSDAKVMDDELEKSIFSYCHTCKWSFSRASDPARCPGHADVYLAAGGYCRECDWHYRRPCASGRSLMSAFGWRYDNNQLMSRFGGSSSALALPDDISDHTHVGYVTWMFCQLKAAIVADEQDGIDKLVQYTQNRNKNKFAYFIDTDADAYG
jgi:GTPase SAR1 family protein